MYKCLIIIDKPGWSYDTIARGLVKYADNKHLAFDIVSAREDLEFIERNHTRYDLIFAMGWTLIISKKKKDNYQDKLTFLDRKKLITGIHSHRSWDNYLSLPDILYIPPQNLLDKLARLKGINVISRRLCSIFQRAGLRNITLTENGVDTELFKPTQPINTSRKRPLILGFSGSKDIAKHDYLKGFSAFILPLTHLPHVEVKVLGSRGANQVKREDMPALYNQIDLYICASTSEGFSQSVLEASACGRGILSTRVGGCEDLIEEHHNGFFIDRDLDVIKNLVLRLEADRSLVRRLGHNNRQRVLEKYAWKRQVKQWLQFIDSHLPANAHHPM
jgi:glycosyltransferase involved in cell wall biosynthesis